MQMQGADFARLLIRATKWYRAVPVSGALAIATRAEKPRGRNTSPPQGRFVCETCPDEVLFRLMLRSWQYRPNILRELRTSSLCSHSTGAALPR